MTDISKRIQSFHLLGEYLRRLVNNDFKAIPKENIPFETSGAFDLVQNNLIEYIENSKHYNPWFTKENVEYALKEWALILNEKYLEEWLQPYQILDNKSSVTIGIVMAGNIPMVGFHDYLCVLISGNKLQAKLSSDDHKLMPILHEILGMISNELYESVEFTNQQLKGFDAIIATGSNNTSRYFEYYFGTYPNIIRRNRNGVAILSGNESEEDLKALADDFFRYFGLGCRNVSKIFVPPNYLFKPLFQALESYQDLQYHSKYFNNYEYQKANYLVNKTMHRDNGFCLFKEDQTYASPIGVIYYEEYEDIQLLSQRLDKEKTQIQCIVGPNDLPFGSSQKPGLNDYADGVDTLKFIKSLRK
jgi:hypothetical protein